MRRAWIVAFGRTVAMAIGTAEPSPNVSVRVGKFHLRTSMECGVGVPLFALTMESLERTPIRVFLQYVRDVGRVCKRACANRDVHASERVLADVFPFVDRLRWCVEELHCGHAIVLVQP